MEVNMGYAVQHECSCMATRRSVWLIEKSGLGDQIEACTFENYNATEQWQAYIKTMAFDFIKQNGRWFFIGGQVGCGKTHICTAITGELIKLGKSSVYMLWMDEVIKIKAVKMDEVEYNKIISKYKVAPVLYIDDFFKTERGKNPTTSDINIAFEILNHRYNNKDLITIISSERSCDDILEIDEAIGSRIYQKCGEFKISIAQDKKKNFRFR